MQRSRTYWFEYAMMATAVVLTVGALVYFSMHPDTEHEGSEDVARGPSSTPANSIAGIELASDGVLTRPTFKPPAGKAYTIPDSERVGVPDGSAIEVVRTLAPMAEAGDARAALAIFHKLEFCWHVLSSGVSAEELVMYKKAGISEDQYLSSAEKNEYECANSQELAYARGKWLEQAAAAGSIEAQLEYSSFPVEVIGGGPLGAVKNPERAREFKTKGLGYLNQLAASGNIDAMLKLSSIYSGGFIVERDMVRAYAMERAVALSQPGLLPPELLEINRSSLSAADRKKAEALANQLHSSCCP